MNHTINTTYEEFDPQGLRLDALRAELQVIDRAIGLLHESKSAQPTTQASTGRGRSVRLGAITNPRDSLGKAAATRVKALLGEAITTSASVGSSRVPSPAVALGVSIGKDGSLGNQQQFISRKAGGQTSSSDKDYSYIIDTTSEQIGE
jgi:hypothetical protein